MVEAGDDSSGSYAWCMNLLVKVARFYPGCSGWLIYCPRLDACWQWKTVWRVPSASGGFREQPEVRATKEEIESAFLGGHWWGKRDPKVPQFEWRAVTAAEAEANRVSQLEKLVAEIPAEIEELDALGASRHADVLRRRLDWYRSELEGFRPTA
jgi:hypothetical protein